MSVKLPKAAKINISEALRDQARVAAEANQMDLRAYVEFCITEQMARPAIASVPRPKKNSDGLRDPRIVGMLGLIDKDITDPRDLMQQLALTGQVYRDLWYEALSNNLMVIIEGKGPMITDKGVKYAGLPPE
jgi:hypothetical protein